MHDETKPHFVLADIKQAVLSGNYVLMPYAVSGLGDTGLSTADVEQVIAGLEPEFFHRCLLSIAEGWEGQPFDWYICPHQRPGRTSKRTGLSLKLVLEASGRVRIFSLHWSKVPK
jgi:hypothetical protein